MTHLKRAVARALVFDAADRLLLIRWRDPVTLREFWEPPGGGSHVGESLEATVRREVAEETGFADIDVGTCLATLDRRFIWAGRPYDCIEGYFLCQLLSGAQSDSRLDEVELAGFVEARWWPLSSLPSIGGELEPPELVDMLERRGSSDAD